jgi:hypothetical protein
LVPGGKACSIMACRSALQAKSTRVDFLLIRERSSEKPCQVSCRLLQVLAAFGAFDLAPWRIR